MPYVQIERVLEKTYEDQKPKYTVHEWACSGWIDGDYNGKFTVKTLSNKMAPKVVDGFEYQAEVDEYQGHVAYKIPTPKQGAPSPAPPQGAPPPPSRGAPSASPPPRRPAPAPVKGYALEELEDLYFNCLQRAKRLTGFTDEQATASVAATLFIQATRENIKVPNADQEAQTRPDVDPVNDGHVHGDDDDLPF